MSLPSILKSPRYSPWRECAQCKRCGSVFVGYANDLSLGATCRLCGFHQLTRKEARAVHYTYLHRLALFLAGYPQPQSHIEFKADQ